MTERTVPRMQKEEHHFTSDDKIKWWGYGEWVEEPEEIEFTYQGFECRIVRTAMKEPYTKELHVFGGNLCGYVKIPSDHPYYHKKYEDMHISCHYGLTYGEVNIGHWIGFDCGHSSDLVPSMEYLKKIDTEMIELRKKFRDSMLFNPTYKNVNYCVNECMDIVDQLVDIKNAKSELHSEWGGILRCNTSDGRNVNMADELNKLENEKI